MSIISNNLHKKYILFTVFALLIVLFYSCTNSNKINKNFESSGDLMKQKDSILDINNDTVFKHIKEKFVFADSVSTPIIKPEYTQDFDYILYSEWLDNDHLIILTSEYNKPNTFLIFNTKKQQIVETIILTELFNICGYISSPTDIHGLSSHKDYFLFSCGGNGHNGVYNLLGFDFNKRKIYSIENYLEDKDIVYKKTGSILYTDGREYSFLPDIFASYGQFSFSENNGFTIAQSTTNFNEDNRSENYFTSIHFPSLSSIIDKNKRTDIPLIESRKLSDEALEKLLYFSNYYDGLPLQIQNGKIYNTPRKNSIYGASRIIPDEASPYLLLPFTYYLNPQTLTPQFEVEENGKYNSVGSISNDRQSRFTGLLINDPETYALKSIFVHGIGVQGYYKRNNNFVITAIFSDYGNNYLVVWDIEKKQPIAKLAMTQKTNYMDGIFFDEKNKQIIGIHSNPAKIFVWNYYPN